MKNDSKKFLLEEKDIPCSWYNVITDMPVKPKPMLHPSTHRPITEEDLSAIFSEEAARQENSTQQTDGLKFRRRCAICTGFGDPLR